MQADIAAALAVSTTPVREALRDLATEGLIQLDAHRGAVVQSLSHDEVREIYELRRLLEPEAYRRAAANITNEELAIAADLQARMDNERDPAIWTDLNAQFHGVLMDSSRSPRLAAILVRLRANASPYVMLSLDLPGAGFGRANEHHRRLMEALKNREDDRAAQIAIEHLESTMRLLADSPIV